MPTPANEKVPKTMGPRYAELTEMTNRFCAVRLTDEYAALARQALAALCRKRPSPAIAGKAETWACAVIYALGQVNFLSDRASLPFVPPADIYEYFGIAASTASGKAKQVRTLLDMNMFGHRWLLPSRKENTPGIWYLSVNGMIVDARDLPVEVQRAAVAKGLIPHVAEPD